MSKSKTVFGIVLGAVAGFATGILTAPKSGKETRDDIKEAGLKAKDTVVTDAHKAKDVAEQKAHEVKDKAEEVIDHAAVKAEELKSRGLQAFEAAKDGFSKDPKASKKK